MNAESFADHYYKNHFPTMRKEEFLSRYNELKRDEFLTAAAADSMAMKEETELLRKALRIRMGQVPRSRLQLKAAAAGASLRRSVFDCQFKAKADVGVPPGDARFGAEKDQAEGFELYGLVVNVLDRQGDICLPNCVANASEFLQDGWIAWSHENLKLPIGYPVSARQDSHGFRVKAVWHTTRFAAECRLMVKERQAARKRVLTSIGYTVLDESHERRDGRQVRLLKSINVYEISIVLLPANPAAEVLAGFGKDNYARADGPEGFAG